MGKMRTRNKSAEICEICGGVIPINQRSIRRKICKQCGVNRGKKKVKENQTTKDTLRRKLVRLRKYNSFLREWSNRDNWELCLTKISKKLDIPVSTVKDHAIRYETRNEAHNFFLVEYANPDNWKPNLSKIGRKLDLSVSTIHECAKREKKFQNNFARKKNGNSI